MAYIHTLGPGMKHLAIEIFLLSSLFSSPIAFMAFSFPASSLVCGPDFYMLDSVCWWFFVLNHFCLSIAMDC